jgi:hypothetical protein
VAFVRADEFQFGFLLLSSSAVFQLGFGSGRTFFKFPNIAKPCSLAVIVKRHTTNFEMKKNICSLLFVFSLLTGCLTNKKVSSNKNYTYKLDTLTLFDESRKREIPIAVYKPKIDNPKIVIFSHGYGQNKGGDYLTYSYLTEYLASKGYYVVSIQHELATDSLIDIKGIPQIVRRPFWERGAVGSPSLVRFKSIKIVSLFSCFVVPAVGRSVAEA